MRKSTAIKYYTRCTSGHAEDIINARQEINRGNGSYGIGWKFEEVDKATFINEVNENYKICCIYTKSRKYIEVNNDNIDNFILA